MQEILSNIEKLLREYDFLRQANEVAAVQTQFSMNKEQAIAKIIRDDWWIGEDAVAEADLSIAGGFMPEARKDQQRLQQLLVQLYEKLQQQGYESDVANLVTTQFQKWQVSGM